jgi:hypothetical protein
MMNKNIKYTLIGLAVLTVLGAAGYFGWNYYQQNYVNNTAVAYNWESDSFVDDGKKVTVISLDKTWEYVEVTQEGGNEEADIQPIWIKKTNPEFASRDIGVGVSGEDVRAAQQIINHFQNSLEKTDPNYYLKVSTDGTFKSADLSALNKLLTANKMQKVQVMETSTQEDLLMLIALNPPERSK